MSNTQHMLNTVWQTVALTALSAIITHQLMYSVVDDTLKNDLVSQLLRAVDAQVNATSSASPSNNANTSNQANNGTKPLSNYSPDDIHDQAFYTSTLPKELLLVALITPLRYYWQIYLERAFPARGSIEGVTVGDKRTLDQKETAGIDDTREEEVVKRWIASGKVRRASLSWWNTFVKWILDLTIGSAFFITLNKALERAYMRQNMLRILKGLKSDFLWNLHSAFFSFKPMIGLISFVIIPAHRRVVFSAGTQFVCDVFVCTIIRFAVPWLLSTEFMEGLVGNMTESVNHGSLAEGGPVLDKSRLIAAPDEL